MFCRHVFGNISCGFRGISRKYLNFVGPRPCEISEALSYRVFANCFDPSPYMHALPEFIPVF